MQTPKEKATELFYKFNGFNTYGLDKMCCKKSAEFLCDEILQSYKQLSEDDDIMFPKEIHYWQQVKEEINKI